MRKSFFIVNPESGKKQGLRIVGTIEELWSQNKVRFQIYITKNHADIASGVHKALSEEATEIIVVGGDGTLLAVVNALEDVPIPIGIIPCGTGNDFARTQGLSLQVETAILHMLNWSNIKKVDVGKSDGSCFLNVASIGIDAEIVKRTQQVKKWAFGSVVYLISSLIEIMVYRPLDISLCIDGVEYQRTVELVAVANGRYYGGGMKIAPMADPTDGMYDVVLARKMKRLRLVQLLPKLYSGGHVGEPEVEIFRGQNIKIKSTQNTSINLDGELTYGNLLAIMRSNSKIAIIDII